MNIIEFLQATKEEQKELYKLQDKKTKSILDEVMNCPDMDEKIHLMSNFDDQENTK